jgi:hypothetical protein
MILFEHNYYSIFVVSCGNKGLACFNGGTCDEAASTCSCLAGFGGSDCRAGIYILYRMKCTGLLCFSTMCRTYEFILL